MTRPDPPSSLAARLYAARGGDLLSYVRHRSGSDADVRDIAQEAFLRFLRLSDPERLRNPDAYIFRIASNVLWERRLRRREEEGRPTAEDTIDEHTPFDTTFTDQLSLRLRSVLDRLPLMQRGVLLLHLRDGMSFADIAVHVGVSTTMAKKHFKNALAACRKWLKDLAPEAGAQR